MACQVSRNRTVLAGLMGYRTEPAKLTGTQSEPRPTPHPSRDRQGAVSREHPHEIGRSARRFQFECNEIPPLTLCTRICVPPPFTAASNRWPPGALQDRPKSAAIPPLRLRALTLAPAPEGSDTRIGPFTELSEIGLHLRI